MSKLHDDWMETNDRLKVLKFEELKLRNKICARVLSDKLEGAVTITKGSLKITATARLNRSVDRELLEAIYEDLTLDEQECIDYKPTLVLSAYKPIEAGAGDSKLMEAITVKPGQASLKIERLPV